LDKYSTFFNKKSIENKINSMRELKKNIKNNDLLDNNEGGVGINEQLMQNALINNIEDDKIKKRKKVIKDDKYIQQNLI
jgi:hypothetical protein